MTETRSVLNATIFFPTWFGEKYLDEVLTAVFGQETSYVFEVLIYDTSSTDATPEIISKYASKYKNLRHKTIKKKDFSHGRTRQQAAEDSNATYMVYLTQDATPAHPNWLNEILRPFDVNDDIVAVIGKQDPRPDAIPLLKGEIVSVFSGLGSDNAITLYQNSSNRELAEGELRFLGFYSDVNSAVRRQFVVEINPYRDVPYAEDQLLGMDVIRIGKIKAYASRANVVHSNDLTLEEYRHRMFDEVMGLRKLGLDVGKISRASFLKQIAAGSIKDAFRIIKDPSYSKTRKVYWFFINPMFHVQKQIGIRQAISKPMTDESNQNYSLEALRNKHK